MFGILAEVFSLWVRAESDLTAIIQPSRRNSWRSYTPKSARTEAELTGEAVNP